VDLPPEILADTCAFCASPLVLSEGEGAPVDGVAPFVIGRKPAQERLARTLRDRWFLPSELRAATVRPEKLKGVLVPFWVFDVVVRSTWSARQGVEWEREERYEEVDDDGDTVTRTRTVREVEWFRTRGSHARSFRDHLVSGSRGLPEAESNALEPFDVGAARSFEPALTAGWIAERPTVGREEAEAVLLDELRQREREAVAEFLPADQVRSLRVDVHDARAERPPRLLLLPVWIATYRGSGATFRLLVNGQTGEVVGRTPVDKAKVAVAVVAVAAVLAALVYALQRWGTP
jgi:hypothetical protein